MSHSFSRRQPIGVLKTPTEDLMPQRPSPNAASITVVPLRPSVGNSITYQMDPKHQADLEQGATTGENERSLTIQPNPPETSRIHVSSLPFEEPESMINNRQTVTFRLPEDDHTNESHSRKQRNQFSDLWEKMKPRWARHRVSEDSTSLSYTSRLQQLKLRESWGDTHRRPSSGRLCPMVPMRWLLLTFRSREVEERYKIHFFSNNSSINTIEQALLIFLVGSRPSLN